MAWNRLLKLMPCHEDGDQDWQRQNVGESKLYRYIHLQDTGKLVDVFNNKTTSPDQRSRALDDIIRREIVTFLYDNGHGKVVPSRRNAFAPPPQTTPVSLQVFPVLQPFRSVYFRCVHPTCLSRFLILSRSLDGGMCPSPL